MTDERVEIYNRPATVEKHLPTTSIVRWQDTGTQGFVPTERIDAALDDCSDDHAELRDGEARDDSHAARTAAGIAALERELDDSEERSMSDDHYAVVHEGAVPVVTHGYATRHAAAGMAALLSRRRADAHWAVAYDPADGPPQNPTLPTATVGAVRDAESERLAERDRQRRADGRARDKRLGL